MSLENAIAMLGRLDLFAGLDPVRLEVLAFTAERRTFKPGTLLFKEGMPGEDAFLILEGEAAMFGHAIGADEPIAARLVAGDFVGERALFTDDPRRATVRAATQLETLRINRDLFLRLIGEFPEIGDTLAQGLRQRLSALSTDLKALSQNLSSPKNSSRE